jgi:hypothetical protein
MSLKTAFFTVFHFHSRSYKWLALNHLLLSYPFVAIHRFTPKNGFGVEEGVEQGPQKPMIA